MLGSEHLKFEVCAVMHDRGSLTPTQTPSTTCSTVKSGVPWLLQLLLQTSLPNEERSPFYLLRGGGRIYYRFSMESSYLNKLDFMTGFIRKLKAGIKPK